jgi:RNA:NAD 2'-phosphotransferase (TPT1/KptA family)
MERRTAQRRRILKAGLLEFDRSAIDCTIHNVSETGAGIEVANPLGIPHEITLNIQTQYVRQHGYIVWRKEKQMGMAFA